MQCLVKMSHFYAYSAFNQCTNINNINDFLKFNGQHSMQDVLMVGKITLLNVSKLVVHALHSNFAMDSLEIWKVMPIFRIKTGGGGGGMGRGGTGVM